MIISRKFVSKCMLLACLLASFGCGTILSQTAYIDGNPVGHMFGDPEVVIYGGVRGDLEVLDALFSDPDEQVEQPSEKWIFQIGFGLDLVLSFVADTIILPITILEEIHLQSIASEEGEQK